MTVSVKTFEELSKQELYDVLCLRSEVFVLEQDCAYQDVDGKDQKALHVLGIKKNTLVAYTRVFNSGDYFSSPSIGRVMVRASERKYGYGQLIMEASIRAISERFNSDKICLSAQSYLIKFYSSLGFVSEGEAYLEDGIPHLKMVKTI
ncbi:GNAT family N-acetyltransferase [Spongiimicrobium sp. 3-5]|uniref:GNAT family N-acetyltransferase n=1 Tax=Spongiimicrobium sp. 3-5 TaxID=3332596 RepID=UPI00397EDC40